MKILLASLVVLLLVLQYRLWFGEGSIQEVVRLRDEAVASQEELARLVTRNKALAAEVADLKRGMDAIEERARADLGMISQGETFYQFVLETRQGGSTDTADDIGLDAQSDDMHNDSGPAAQTDPG